MLSPSRISCSTDWFRYVPVTVEHSDDTRSSDRFILHQGIQRRIGLTICHEGTNTELNWKNVREVVVGKFFIHGIFSMMNNQRIFQVEFVVNKNSLPMISMRKFSR